MSKCTHKNGVDGIRRQAQELIEQAYNRGFKAGYDKAFSTLNENWQLVTAEAEEKGRNDAWKAARKIMNQNDASWGMKDMKEIFCLSYSTDVMLDLSASEAIEKIRAYEERKKQEEDSEIHVGDEVIHICEITEPFIVITVDNDAVYGFDKNGDYRGVSKVGTDFKKTGRHFPEIAEVLKKMREDKE